MRYKKIAIIANETEKAQEVLKEINSRYKFIQLNILSAKPDADLIIVLGGDGFMLHCLHAFMDFDIPIYGINCGTVGFLLNNHQIEELSFLLENSVATITHPLEMTVYCANGSITKKLAINEVSLFRKKNQAVKIEIRIDGQIRLSELVCDGILLATPAGSSAYNCSVNGPILPIGSDILALTPISPFRPKRWGGALLPHTATVVLTVLDRENRPVNAVADFFEVEDVTSVMIKEDRSKSIKLLFNPNHSLEERILKEQFSY
jgi:NAD+ kinase